MRILVTGGTGFLGSAVVKRLDGNVTIFARHAYKKYRTVCGDIARLDELEKAFPADAVIHLAANFDENNPDIFSINVNGTRNVVELCKKYKVKHLVHMSSSAALGEVKIAYENTEPKPKTRYGLSKKQAEEIVQKSGLNYTIIRAPVILGPSPMWLGVIKAARKKFPLIGSGKNHFHTAYVDDVADLIVASLNNRKAFGSIFHVATKDTPTYEEFYRMICTTLGTEMTNRHVPVFLVRTISSFNSIFSKLHGKKPNPVFSKSNITRLTRERIVKFQNAKRKIGFSPKYDTESAVRATVNHFKKSGLI